MIGSDGENVGVVSTRVALAQADEAGMDLVEISPGAEPPVCKILDYGKYRYEAQKKRAEAKKKQAGEDLPVDLYNRSGEILESYTLATLPVMFDDDIHHFISIGLTQ